MPREKQVAGFSTLITKFSNIILPITLNPDAYRAFEKKNKPLSIDTIQSFFTEEGEEIDEFTEYIPCFRLPDTAKFHGFVYWKAGLMEYHYFLITFDKKGNFINKKRIGGTIRVKDALKVEVAEVNSSWKITVQEGLSDINTQILTPATFTNQFQISLSEEGIIQ